MFYADEVRALLENPVLATDSYKLSHWTQYPPGTTGMFSYISARGGAFPRTVMFGLQMILADYFSRPITREHIAVAAELAAAHGQPFNAEGFSRIVERHGGYWPVRIRALAEGSVVPTQTPLVTIESTDPLCFWAVSFVETMLMQLWYPIAVATLSWDLRQIIAKALADTSDDAAAQLPGKLHNFGYRGASSPQSAARGAVAHLTSFNGTDVLAGILAARAYYDAPMAGFALPAAEHSTITAWGREGEIDAYRNMLARFAKPGAKVACVSDSYDIYNAVENIWGGALRKEVVESGAVVIIRPDSGYPADVVLRCATLLERAFGAVSNDKGYKVLNHVRILQGDGINRDSIREILAILQRSRYSADNIIFGMGGGLMQQVNRDTLQFAMKCSAVRVHGGWRDAFKDPVTDRGKASKRGRMTVWRHTGSNEYLTTRLGGDDDTPFIPPGAEWTEAMQTVWENGKLLRRYSLTEIRARLESV